MNTEYSATLVSLDTLRVGQRAVLVRVTSAGPVRRRMVDMGLLPGVELTVERLAPLGDPMEVRVKGYHLALRKSEARTITVAPAATSVDEVVANDYPGLDRAARGLLRRWTSLLAASRSRFEAE
ncbi:MAG: hypothetical protein CL878_12960 [Dehalococcoidia bacterium]|nr:hypothetical protein [Dehalococcoidia bacterium]